MSSLFEILQTYIYPVFFKPELISQDWLDLINGVTACYLAYIGIFIFVVLPFKFFKKLVKVK